jgi:hypothetical protein
MAARSLLIALSLLASGCSYGLFQTGHTQPTGTFSGSIAVTAISNELSQSNGRGIQTNTAVEPALRVGVSDQLDVGLSGFLMSGARADVKYNLMPPDAPLAIAPRVGAGYQFSYEVAMAQAGAIVSYRVGTAVEPYLGVAFANHWINGYPAIEDPLPPGKTEVGRSYSGDGLLQTHLGLAIGAGPNAAFLLELGRHWRMQDDAGDHYRFVSTNVYGLALRIGPGTPGGVQRTE